MGAADYYGKKSGPRKDADQSIVVDEAAWRGIAALPVSQHFASGAARRIAV